jgi:DNA excision repair protein ERCC-5
MGVHGLWQILDQTSQPIRVETLHGKKLAVDASIWLYQFVKAMRDSKGELLNGAHLVGFLRRICKLLFHGIKPVFVFDGAAPELKKRTIHQRKQRRSEAQESVGKTAEKVLRLQLKLHGLEAIELGYLNPEKNPAIRKAVNLPDDYELPLEKYIDFTRTIDSSAVDPRLATETEIHDFIDYQKRHIDFSRIDINSIEFQALPITLQHEIILDLKNKSRAPSLARVEQMLTNSESALDFSKSQIKNMIHRHTLTDRYHQTLKKTNIVQKRVAGSRQKEFVLVKKDGTGWEMSAREKKGTAVVDLTGLDGFASEVVEKSMATVDMDDYIEDDVPLEEIIRKIDHSPNEIDNDTEKLNGGLLGKYLDVENRNPSTPDLGVDLSPTIWARNWEMAVPARFPETYPKYSEILSVEILCKSLDSLIDLKRILTRRIEKSSEEKVCHHLFYLQFVESAIMMKEKLIKEDAVDADFTIKEPPGNSFKRRIVIDSDSENDLLQLEDEYSGRNEPLTEVELHSPQKSSLQTPTLAEGTSDDFGKSIFNPVRAKHLSPVQNNQPFLISSDDDEEWETVSLIGTAKKTTKNNFDSRTEEDKSEMCAEFGSIVDPFSTQVDKSNVSSYKRRDSVLTVSSDAESILSRISNERARQLGLALPLQNVGVSDLVTDEIDEYYADLHSDNFEQLRLQTETELVDLYAQHRNNLRDVTQVSPQMVFETQELLRLFGIPFLTAPAEAESQCAYLQIQNLVDGIVTDDSDVFLFGGTVVYKNLFDSKKYVERYTMEGINEIGLDRSQLIQMAYLLGSDYTTGIRGLGPVSSVEVVTTWKSAHLQGLVDFKEWAFQLQKGTINADDTTVQKRLRSYCKKLDFPVDFPDSGVFDAYMKPNVDESLEPFQWGVPLLDPIREYFRIKLGWNLEKVDAIVVPVIKELRERKSNRQTNLEEFFPITPKKHKSVRVQNATRGGRNKKKKML